MSAYIANEMANDWAKEINKITVAEGTNDDYGVDDLLDNKRGVRVSYYCIDDKQRLISVKLDAIVDGYLVCIDTAGRFVAVGNENTKPIAITISKLACDAIKEYYCPSFASFTRY